MTSTVAVTAGAGVHTGQIPAYDAVHALTVSGLTAYNGAVVSGRLTTPDMAELLAPAATGTVAAGSVTLALNCDTDEMATLVGAGPTSPLCGLLSLSVVSTGEQIAVAPVNIAPAVRPGTGTSTPTESPGASLAEQTAAIAAHNLATAAHPFSAVDKFRFGGTAGAVTEGDITALSRTALARATAALWRTDIGAEAAGAAATHAGLAVSAAHSGIQAPTAESDFLCGNATPFGSWVRKTLAEVKSILGLGTAAYTAATAYYRSQTPAASSNISGSVALDFTSLTPHHTLTGNVTALTAPTNLALGDDGMAVLTLAGFTMPAQPAAGQYWNTDTWDVAGPVVLVTITRSALGYHWRAESQGVAT